MAQNVDAKSTGRTKRFPGFTESCRKFTEDLSITQRVDGC